MTNCVKDVRLSSEIPDYARGQHGDLAEQTRVVAQKSGLDLAKASACTVCHGVSEKMVGPAFRDVAARYANDSAAESRLVAKLKAGGSGAWGSAPMPPQAQVKEADARTLVQWILRGAQ